MNFGVPYGVDMDLGYNGQITTAWSNPLTSRQLHHSHIQTLIGLCAKRFEWEYVIQPQAIPPAGRYADTQMNIGSAVHEVVDTVLSGTTDKLPTIMNAAYDKYVIPTITDPKAEGKVSEEYQKDAFAALEYITNNFDRFQVNTEKPFVIPSVNQLSPELRGVHPDWSFAGHMDLVQFDDEQHTAQIVDLKCRGKSNFSGNNSSSQAPMYALACLYYGYTPTFKYVEIVKGKVLEQEIKITEGRLHWLFVKARQAIEEIESGRFPISPNGWWCSSRYCKWWYVCRGKYEPDEVEVDSEIG